MPLLDHFRPPLSRLHSWRTFHGTWAVAIARLLNRGGLPDGYVAAPFVDRGGPVEIDVAALQHGTGADGFDAGGWAPAAPKSSVTIHPPGVEEARVEVLTDDGDPRLAAAIELVSPGNKDRPATRLAFAAKCADHLGRAAGLVVIDLVTVRRTDPHAALLEALGAGVEGAGPPAPSAVAYHVAGRADLQMWPEALAVGRSLPTLPLWLAADLCVPLDLELSYTTACADLLIRQAG